MITNKTRDFINAVIDSGYTQVLFNTYVTQCGGIDKLKKEDLDAMINKIPAETIHSDSFMDIYKLVSANESGKIIKIWTWIAGIASVVSLGVSIISLCKG